MLKVFSKLRFGSFIVILLLLVNALISSNTVSSARAQDSQANITNVALTWERSLESDTISSVSIGGDIAAGLQLPTHPENVWDNGVYTPDINKAVVPAGYQWASWPQISPVDIRHFKAKFTFPDGADPSTTQAVLYDPYYNTNVIPINDNMYVFVNGVLQFTGGTNYGAASGGISGYSSVANETDGWYIPSKITLTGFEAGENIIDIVVEERAGWGGLGYLNLGLVGVPTSTPTPTPTFTPTPTPTPTPSPTTGPRKVVVFLQGVCTNADAGFGLGKNGFNELQNILKEKGNYRVDPAFGKDTDFLLYSYRGGSMLESTTDNRWVWYHDQYFPNNPIEQSLSNSAVILHKMLVDYHEKYKDTTFIVVGHSLGGAVAFEEILQNVNSQSNEPSLISKIITIDSPLRGVPSDLAGLSFLGNKVRRLASPINLDCAVDGEAFNQLTIRYVDSEEQHKLIEAVSLAKEKGVDVVTIGNKFDCLWGPDGCLPPIKWLFPIHGDTSIQWIDTSPTIEYSIPFHCLGINCILDTHSAILKWSDSLSTIVNEIGPQNSQ